MRFGVRSACTLLLPAVALACVGIDEEDEGSVGRLVAPVTCDPYLEVYPVHGPHNGGYDRNWWNFQCPPHPADAPDNSDFIGGDHYGNDIFGERGTSIVAARSGTIVRAGYASVSGNRVTIRDECGWYYFYAHLNSIDRWGGWVPAGTQIGTLGNTGAEWTAPHLHFSIYPDDCYSCGINPFPYLQAVDATSCSVPCDCTPGETQARPCCDCGTQTRSCGQDCRWGGWGACGGPDPGGGSIACQTGELGACAEGRVRCVAGCRTCVRLHEPTGELCDTLDNDCDGETNEGGPSTMGTPPPPFAAMLKDFSHPPAIAAGARGAAWVEFENVGSAAWRPGEVWLAPAEGTPEGERSRFFAEGAWPAWDVAAVAAGETPPGGVARLELVLAVPPGAAPGEEIEETFGLTDREGAFILCPGPEVTFSVAPLPAPDEDAADADAGDTVPLEPPDLVGSSGCGCAVAR